MSVARNRIENLLCQATRMTDQSRYWAALPISTLSMNIQVVFFEFPVFPKFPKNHCSDKNEKISQSHPTAGTLDHHDFRFTREGHTSGCCFSSSTDNFHKSQDSSPSLELNFQPKQQTMTKNLQITAEKLQTTNKKEQHELQAWSLH